MMIVFDKTENREVRMHSVDAREAIAADPERYSHVKTDVVIRKSGSLEDRLNALEERVTNLEGDNEIDRAPEAMPDEPQPALPAPEAREMDQD